MLEKIADALEAVRTKTPLVQAITNYVTINDCANILLCFGASPAMCEAKEEVEEFASIISALYLNLGTMTQEQHEAAILAAKKASAMHKPIVLDPVACGAISRKAAIAHELLDCSKISVIKGNVGEIKSLAGYSGRVRGVDSIDDGEDAIEACRSLANKFGTVVAATGKTDIITDGKRTCLIENGTEMFTLVTGSGCMVGALVSAAVGASDDSFIATVAAILAMNIAGEHAAAALPRPMPGSFKVGLMDNIYALNRAIILKDGKVRCI
jgi:hydroxyethylthiazole kinase